MQVFKFGGASIKDANAVKNVGEIITKFGKKPLVVVVSAMGKTTRALEDLLTSYGSENFQANFEKVETYHQNILQDLFPENHHVLEEVERYFTKLAEIDFSQPDKVLLHAEVVSFGEIISSVIISNYLHYMGLDSYWLYAPDVVKSQRLYSEGSLLWDETEKQINHTLASLIGEKIIVTQGYIASSSDGIITLGKEGSDFTAAIFASCLKAEKVTIWKDVPGILNADPKEIMDPVQLFKLDYKEASEMTYYGATVIHPKTIKPLALKSIPLEVRSFDHPEANPTVIHRYKEEELEASIIFKRNQCLFSFKVLDYTFVDEENLATIFKVLHELNLPINMMQNSAISLSVCFNYDADKVERLLSSLADKFTMYYNKDLKLITIKNFTDEVLKKYAPEPGEILLEQRTRNNYRALVRA
ncbi:MAG: aspartate kinase [Cyclobacteriaceae bacterium]|nr:aspartate kinase [Cyclobacteriaceae bacterium]